MYTHNQDDELSAMSKGGQNTVGGLIMWPALHFSQVITFFYFISFRNDRSHLVHNQNNLLSNIMTIYNLPLLLLLECINVYLFMRAFRSDPRYLTHDISVIEEERLVSIQQQCDGHSYSESSKIGDSAAGVIAHNDAEYKDDEEALLSMSIEVARRGSEKHLTNETERSFREPRGTAWPKGRKCLICNMWQPIRTKHCHYCDKCVCRYDHHCHFLSTCIGEGNYCTFVSFIFYETLVDAAFTFILFRQLSQRKNVFNQELYSYAFLMLTVSVHAITVFLLSLLSLTHIYLTISNQTTWELFGYNISYLKSLPRDVSDRPFDAGDPFVNVRNSLCWPAGKHHIMYKDGQGNSDDDNDDDNDEDNGCDVNTVRGQTKFVAYLKDSEMNNDSRHNRRRLFENRKESVWSNKYYNCIG